LFKSRSAAIRLETLELTLDWEASAVEEKDKRTYFCPIWFDHTQSGKPWWMTFNHQTYTHDLLSSLGFKNVFADRKRRYPLDADLGLTEAVDPGERDTRYPRVTSDEIIASSPDMIFLPDEPYAFDETFQGQLEELLADTPAIQCGRVYMVDGSLLTWHGTRLARAIRELPALLAG
jgi:ABC-type Fe3+-hydroxamate transport system substrate-binding protein